MRNVVGIVGVDVDGVLNCYETVDLCGIYLGIEDVKVEYLKQLVV